MPIELANAVVAIGTQLHATKHLKTTHTAHDAGPIGNVSAHGTVIITELENVARKR